MYVSFETLNQATDKTERHQLTISVTCSVFLDSSRRAKWEVCNRLSNGTPFLNCLFNVQYAIKRWIKCAFLGTLIKAAISWILRQSHRIKSMHSSILRAYCETYLSGGIVGMEMTGATERFLARTRRAVFILSVGDTEASFFTLKRTLVSVSGGACVSQ